MLDGSQAADRGPRIFWLEAFTRLACFLVVFLTVVEPFFFGSPGRCSDAVDDDDDDDKSTSYGDEIYSGVN